MNEMSGGRWVAAVAGAVLLAACGAGTRADVVDKGGSETLVLHLGTIDGEVDFGLQPSAPQAFVDALEEVSGGRLQVEVETSFGDRTADNESKLVEAIASGSLDGGWPATRAFAAAGIGGLEPVEAPMTITSYAAQDALVSGPIADQLLGQLEGSGVVGLSLGVGPLRRPFAANGPLLAPEDWDGVTFRSFNSSTQTDAIRALGAEPVQLGIDWSDAARAGTLKGTEFDFSGFAAAGHFDELAYVTRNVVLWPKVYVFAFNQKRFDSLSDQQREWVRQAAEQATSASIAATYDETDVVRKLCEGGVRFFDASDAQIDAMRVALQPVIDGLAADAGNAPLIEAITELAGQHPEIDAPEIPADCRTVDKPSTEPADPDAPSSIPDGTYRVEITVADIDAAGLSNGPGWTGTWTLQIEDATYQLTCRTLDRPDRDCGGSGGYAGPLEAGHLLGTGDDATFVFDVDLMSELTGCKLPVDNGPDHCYSVPDFPATWTLDGDQLVFVNQGGPESWDKFLEPWQKIN